MSSEQSSAIVRRSIEEIWNTGNMTAVEDLFATDYVGHFAATPEPVCGHSALRAFASHYFTAFPDLSFSIDDLVTQDNKVVVRWSARGTHRGPLMGLPPTGKAATTSGMWIHRVANGRIAEQWGVFDTLGLLQQLGAIPAPA